MVDIIDENLNVLYQISKQIAHQKGLLHKTVIAEIINSRGEFLLIRPYSHKQDAGQLVSPVGGHVAAGETDVHALKREVAEEVGISGNYRYLLKGKHIFNRYVLGRQENHYFLLYEVFTDLLPKLGDEAESYQYFSREELRKGLKERPKDFGDAYFFVVNHFYPKLLD